MSHPATPRTGTTATPSIATLKHEKDSAFKRIVLLSSNLQNFSREFSDGFELLSQLLAPEAQSELLGNAFTLKRKVETMLATMQIAHAKLNASRNILQSRVVELSEHSRKISMTWKAIEQRKDLAKAKLLADPQSEDSKQLAAKLKKLELKEANAAKRKSESAAAAARKQKARLEFEARKAHKAAALLARKDAHARHLESCYARHAAKEAAKPRAKQVKPPTRDVEKVKAQKKNLAARILSLDAEITKLSKFLARKAPVQRRSADLVWSLQSGRAPRFTTSGRRLTDKDLPSTKPTQAKAVPQPPKPTKSPRPRTRKPKAPKPETVARVQAPSGPKTEEAVAGPSQPAPPPFVTVVRKSKKSKYTLDDKIAELQKLADAWEPPTNVDYSLTRPELRALLLNPHLSELTRLMNEKSRLEVAAHLAAHPAPTRRRKLKTIESEIDIPRRRKQTQL